MAPHLPRSFRSCRFTRTAGSLGRRRFNKDTSALLRGLHCRKYANEGSAVGFGFEGDLAFDGGKYRVILAHADARTRMPLGAALTRDDVARNHGFTAVFLDAEATTGRIATVAGRTACLFVCHDETPRLTSSCQAD